MYKKQIHVKSFTKKDGTHVKGYLREIKGIRVRQVNSRRDLKKVDLEEVLDKVDFDDVKGLYFDIPNQDSKTVTPVFKEKGEFGVIAGVHDRLFPSKVDIYTDKWKHKYIKEDELENLY